MAQNDIIDIDEIIDANIDLSQPIPAMPTQQPPPVADKIYPSGGETPGQFVSNDFKNFLVDKIGVAPSIIDTVLGRPYGFRDRFANFNPKDALRDSMRGLIPGDQPLDRDTQQPFGFDIQELFNPTNPDIKQAEKAGINPTQGAPFQVQKDSSYLPPDNFERGIKVLLKEAYPGIPLADFELATEPRTGRIVYKDPTTGQKQFVSPPGIDWADVSAVMEPIMLEIAGGTLGFFTGIADAVGPKTSAAAGALIGLGTTAQLTESGGLQATGAAAGAAMGTVSAPFTFTVAGETMAHYLWRLSNLKGMKERGILDETYTPEKIQKVALNDSKMVAAYSAGGNAAFGALAKVLGRNPADTLGIDQTEFLKAFDEVEKMAGGTGPESILASNLTTPQVLGAGDAGTPLTKDAMQNEIDMSASKSPEVERRFLEQKQDIDIGYEKIFDDVGIDTVVFRDQDIARVKKDFGRDVGGYFDVENIRPQTGKNVVPTDRKAVANQVTKLVRGADPEGVFDLLWTKGKITKVDTFLDMVPASKQTEFKNLIFRDFLENTKPIDGVFNPNAISKYLVDHGDQLKSIYGEEFVNGLRSYNKLIKDVSIVAPKIGIADADFAKFVNVLARSYLGIFTRPGRMITAGTKMTEKFRRKSFEEMLLDPAELAKRIRTKQFLESNQGQVFFSTTRALARAYEKTDGDFGDMDPDQITSFPTQERIIDIDLEGLEMNKGGNPLMELQYGYGDN
tara:strand:+ start:152 stop:2356 length:2205 start_codon:yes stop_codon:yes gene_type:complete